MILGINSTLPFVTRVNGMNGADWFDIQVVGRHADVGSLVFIGNRVGGGVSEDIGILDTATGNVTYIDGALNGTGGTSWTGIDCDRRTGIYVAGTNTNGAGSGGYPSFWSTDLTTWTECDDPGTLFHNNDWIIFEDTHELWYWQSGTSATGHYVSGDGKTFVEQQVYFNGFGQFDLGYSSPVLRAELNPLDSNVVLMPGDTTRLFRSDPQAYPEVPVYSTTSDIGNMREVVGPNNRAFTHSDNLSLRGGVVAFEDAVYVMSSRGDIMKNDAAMLKDTWTQIAEKGTGNDANELIDEVDTFNHFAVVDGVFWVQEANSGNWWSYSAGGEPVGYGWSLDTTYAGPFSAPNGTENLITSAHLRSTEFPLAFVGRTAGNSDYRIYYAKS